MTALQSISPAATTVRRGAIGAAPLRAVHRRSARTIVAGVFWILSAVLAWMVLYLSVLSAFEANHRQHELYGALRSQLAEGTAPVGAPIESGSPVALLDIASAGVHDLVVVEGTQSGQLKDGPGHAPGSVLPGQSGTSVVMGKGLSFGAPFAHITELRKGDLIKVTTGQGSFTYRVTQHRSAGDTEPAPVATGGGRLTLVTAAGQGSLSRLRPSDAVYVDADLVGTAVVAGPVSVGDPNDVPMSLHMAPGLWAEIVLGAQLLVAVAAAVAWAWLRWSRLGAWIAGVPALIAALWLVSSLVARTLPALV